MKTRIVHTRFWQDEFVNTLTPKEKLLFIYLLTNDRVSLTGMYELPDKYIKADLEITTLELETAKEKLKTKIGFINGWIKIYNHDKYNCYAGAKTGVARNNELDKIPSAVKDYGYYPDTSMDTSSDTPNKHKSKTINHKPIIINNKTEIINQKEKQEITSYLVEKGMDKDLVENELNKFISYWTELNHSGTKQRWQLEKTFEVKKRLTNWFSNINKFGGKSGSRLGRI